MKIKLNSVKSVFAQFFTTITQLTFSNFFYFLSLNPFNHSFLTSSPPPSPPRLLDTHDTSTKWFTNGPTDMFSSSISVILFFIFFLFKFFFFIILYLHFSDNFLFWWNCELCFLLFSPQKKIIIWERIFSVDQLVHQLFGNLENISADLSAVL